MEDFYEYISRPKGNPPVREEFRDITEPLNRPDATLGDTIDAQLNAYGFAKNTYDLEHEVAHSILGKCFLDMNESPIRLPYPHNGNIFSEPLVEVLQRPISILIDTGERVSPPSGAQLKSELENYAPGKFAADFNALVSCEDYANRMEKGQTGFEVFREHDYDTTKVFSNSEMNNFQAAPPDWSRVFSDEQLDRISVLAAPKINKILDYLEEAGKNSPEDSTHKRAFFNQVLRDIPAAEVLEPHSTTPDVATPKNSDSCLPR